MFRVTVIGAGDRGSAYMRMIKKYFCDAVIFDTICDILPERMQKAYDEYGFKQKTDRWEEAVQNSADIVIIATPAYFHCDIASFAMRCGSHVLTEKPFDLSLAKCFALLECQKATGKTLCIGLQYRNMPFHRSMKRAVESGVFGDNLMMHYSDIRETRPKIAMHDARYGNGGPMVDMACHFFDLMSWYYNSDPVRVYAQWRKNAINRESLVSIETKAADSCFMTVEYENGALGNITLNWGLPSGVIGGLFAMASGSEALMNYNNLKDGVNVITKGGEVTKYNPLPEDEDDLIQPERAVFKNFLADINKTGTVQVPLKRGIVTLASSMAALRSSVIGRPVTLAEIYEKKPTIAQCLSDEEWTQSGQLGEC